MSTAAPDSSADRGLRPLLWLSGALGLVLAGTSASPWGDLDGSLGDAWRHIAMARLTALHGWQVWTTPMEALLAATPVGDVPPVWPQLSYVYPPGVLVWAAPFATCEWLGLPTRAAIAGAVGSLVVFAHLAVASFARLSAHWGPWGRWLVLPLVWLELLHWALGGQVEVLWLWLGLRGIEEAAAAAPGRSLLWLSAAAFFHLRAAILLPLALLQLRQRWRAGGRPTWTEALAAALVLAAAAALVAIAVAGTALPNNNRAALMRVGVSNWTVQIALATAALAAVAATARRTLVAVTLTWAGALALLTAQAQPWHAAAWVVLPALAAITTHRRDAGPVEGERDSTAAAAACLWIAACYGPLFRRWPGADWLVQALERFAP